MTDADRLDKYLEMYYFELEHRETINNGLGIAVAVLVALGGGLLFYFREGPSFRGAPWEWCYYVLVTLSAVSLALAIYFFGRSWFGRVYHYITPPNEIEAWRSGEKGYHDAFPEERPNLAERTLQLMLVQVADLTTRNRASNRIKSTFAFFGRACTLGAVALMLLAFVPYSVLSQRKAASAAAQKKTPPPTRAASKPKVRNMSNEQNRQGVGDAKPAAPPPEKQPFPQPDSFREGNRNPERKSDSDSGDSKKK